MLRGVVGHDKLDHRGSFGRGTLLGVCGGLLLLSCLGIAEARAEVVGRPSVGIAGVEGNGGSYSSNLSGTGRFVAFQSEATNLVRGDTNGVADVFVRDLEQQVTTRVSVGPRGAQANEGSYSPSISRDKRFAAFTSQATNLVAGKTVTGTHVYVRDRQAGTTRLVSVASDGTPATNGSFGYSLARDVSADGRFVLFYSEATNLVPGGDANGETGDMFVHELATGRTELVSVSSGGVQGSSYSLRAASRPTGDSWCSARRPETWFPVTPTAGRTCSCAIGGRAPRSG
jgi:Tol biopolymer transport system component